MDKTEALRLKFKTAIVNRVYYRKIIKALHETHRLMQEIDQIDFLPKGKK